MQVTTFHFLSRLYVYSSVLALLSVCLLVPELQAQSLGDYLGDESVLYAETKQVNQFFRRFNCEENVKGKRYYPEDEFYRNPQMREKYIWSLFDKESSDMPGDTKQRFIEYINGYNPRFLNFHGGEWFAEVQTEFTYKGRPEPITLFLKLEKAKVGSKWVFTHAIFKPFQDVFSELNSESSSNKPAFIHPLSHELDFVELIKVFRNKENLEQYTTEDYRPDYLTLLLYEIKRGNLSFNTVNDVKFHFFQIEGWYFELKEFQRRSNNRGWLISQLLAIPKGQKDLLLRYIYQN